MSENHNIEQLVVKIAENAKMAAGRIVALSTAQKNAVLLRIAGLLEAEKAHIQQENELDLVAGRAKGLSPAMLDRLTLSNHAFTAMIAGLHEVAALADPVGSISDLAKRPNGLQVGRMRVPLGVIAMIYESRPNVTVDAAALCLKAGNAVILRGGSEAIRSNVALAGILQEALRAEGLPAEAIQVLSLTDRAAVEVLLRQEETIDLVIPRGGEGLIRFVCGHSRIPVLKHYKGVCHIYVDKDADLAKATPIILNSKTQRPGVCNALEGLLVDAAVADEYVPLIAKELAAAGVTIKGCARAVALADQIVPALDTDWGTEFLNLTLCLRVVDDVDEAKAYIRRYGSQHTEAILTENYTTASQFVAEVDASAVVVNASTRFNDGGQLGLGAEIGISTTKLHAYGPMGLEELTTRKFVVFGQGQIRD